MFGQRMLSDDWRYARGVPARAKARVRSQNGLDRWMS